MAGIIKVKLSAADFDLLVRGEVLKQVANVGYGNQDIEFCLEDIGYDSLQEIINAAESDMQSKQADEAEAHVGVDLAEPGADKSAGMFFAEKDGKVEFSHPVSDVKVEFNEEKKSQLV